MPTISSNIVDLITGGISFLLTLMVLSYLIGDNPAFRVAVNIFIGVAAGYTAAVAWHQVLYPRLIVPLATGNLLTIIPLVMGLLLLFKISPRTSRLGTPSMAFLVGVGAAVAIGGAVMGTLFPQTWASMRVFDLTGAGQYWLERLIEAIFILVGTVATLVYFHFGAKATASGMQRGKLVNGLGWLGQIFIAITFGVLFAGVFMAAMTALIKSLNSIILFLSLL
jgi:hypothetical protein